MGQVSDLQAACLNVAELLDEKGKGQQSMADAQQRSRAAQQRVAQLTAQASYGGINLSERIAQAQQEIAEADAIISAWPAVSAELDQRIAAAQETAKRFQIAAMTAELESLTSGEEQRMTAFTDALVAFTESGVTALDGLKRKTELRRELRKLGVQTPDFGASVLPACQLVGIGDMAAVQRATQIKERVRKEYAAPRN